MFVKLSKTSLMLSITLCIVMSILVSQESYAADPISAKSIGVGETTIIEFTNNDDSEVSTFRIWLGKDFSFNSFKSEDGWTGKKTPQGVIIFSSNEPIKKGESVKFGIKTDKQNPAINWKAIDSGNKEVQAGFTTVAESAETKETESKEQKDISGINDSSVFRIIPEKPKTGSTVRVVGESFNSNKELDIYLDDKKLDSLETDDNGNFVITTKIPSSASVDRVNFVIRDEQKNEKSISIRLGEGEEVIKTEEIRLTVKGIPDKFPRGEQLLVTGTAQPGSSIVGTIKTPDGNTLATEPVKADSKGNWAFPVIININALIGKYTAEITDGRDTVSKSWEIILNQNIQVIPEKIKYNAGDIMKFNGTAATQPDVEILVKNPIGQNVLSKVVKPNNFGEFNFDYKTEKSSQEGTYTVFAFQGKQNDVIYVGLGQLPEEQLTVKADKLNYKAGENATLIISGPTNSNISLLIIDPTDKQKFTDTIVLGLQGKTNYQLDTKGYQRGIYSAVIKRANAQSIDTFAVGLEQSVKPISLSITKTDYELGESILALGSTSSNSLVSLTLSDSNGNKVNTIQTYTNKEGMIKIDPIRIPLDGPLGTWSLKATSGANFKTVEFKVHQTITDEFVVKTNKITTDAVGKFVEIYGFGASIDQKVSIKITDPEGDLVGEINARSTKDGNYEIRWYIPKQSIPGKYLVDATDAKGKEASAEFDY